jgi:hypothetical protein
MPLEIKGKNRADSIFDFLAAAGVRKGRANDSSAMRMDSGITGPAPRRFERPLRFLRARLSPEGYFGLHLTIGLLVIIATGAWFADVAEDMSRNAATRVLDEQITAWFIGHATPLLTRIARAITFFGSVPFITSATVFVGLVLAIRKSFYRLIALVSAAGGGALLNLALKHLFHRQRPMLENPLVTPSSYGFPSGHTMGATIFSATMAPRDPAAALTWAATVSDPTKRSATVDRLVSGWLRRSPNDAKAWIQNSTLPDPEKTRLLALPPR